MTTAPPAKTEVTSQASNFEVESHHTLIEGKMRVYNLVSSARLSVATLALAAGVAVLVMSANALSVYEDTRLPAEFLLPLWPEDFNLRPTVALVVTSSLVVVANLVSIIASKVQLFQSRTMLSTPINVAAPVVGLIAALIAMIFYYAVDAMDTVDTVQSWSCRWRNVGMLTEPHFGTLCKQSEASLGLIILLVPLEFIAVCVTAYEIVLCRNVGAVSRRAKAGSPALA